MPYPFRPYTKTETPLNVLYGLPGCVTPCAPRRYIVTGRGMYNFDAFGSEETKRERELVFEERNSYIIYSYEVRLTKREVQLAHWSLS